MAKSESMGNDTTLDDSETGHQLILAACAGRERHFRLFFLPRRSRHLLDEKTEGDKERGTHNIQYNLYCTIRAPSPKSTSKSSVSIGWNGATVRLNLGQVERRHKSSCTVE